MATQEKIKGSLPSRVSLKHVAERAGVSTMTASNVIRGRHEQMAPDTCERVIRAMKELRYTPVAPPARQSRHVETRVIGLIFDSIEFEDMWGAAIYRGMRDAAREAKYDLLTLLRPESDWVVDSEEMRFLDRRSDAVVFVLPEKRQHVLEAMVAHGMPAVTCSLESGFAEVPSVVLDNEGAMRQAVEHLMAAGHREIAFLTELTARNDIAARQRGYEGAMEAAGLAPRLVVGESIGSPGWRTEMKSLLSGGQISAIVAAGDAYALEAWQLAESIGLQVPRDVSITGMDNVPEGVTRGLTTFSFDSVLAGRRAVEAAVQLIAGAPPAACGAVLPVEIVIRDSVAAPSGGII